MIEDPIAKLAFQAIDERKLEQVFAAHDPLAAKGWFAEQPSTKRSRNRGCTSSLRSGLVSRGMMHAWYFPESTSDVSSFDWSECSLISMDGISANALSKNAVNSFGPTVGATATSSTRCPPHRPVLRVIANALHRDHHAPEFCLDVMAKASQAAVLPVAIDQRPAKLIFQAADRAGQTWL